MSYRRDGRIAEVGYNFSVKRAYGHEPILLDASPVKTEARPARSQLKQNKRQKKTLALALFLLIGVGIIVTMMFLRSPNTSNSDLSRLASTVTFPLYEPEWLPEGWFVEPHSIEATSQVVTFTINDKAGKRLIFTEQPKPPQDNLDTFYAQQLSGNKALKTQAGEVIAGQFEGSLLAGLTAGRTWVLVRAVSAVDQQHFDRLIESIAEAD